MVAVGDTAALIQYVNSEAPQYGIDPAAALAVAMQEGWGGTIGDSGQAYGPWQDHLGIAGRPFGGSAPNNQEAQTWAWSSDGINYVLSQMATTGKAAGLSGYQAVANIAQYFEAPAEPAQGGIGWQAEANNAWKVYQGFADGTQAGTSGSVSTVDPSLASSAAIVSGESSTSAGTANAPSFLGSTALGVIFARLGSRGFWWAVGFIIVAGLLIIIGIWVYFKSSGDKNPFDVVRQDLPREAGNSNRSSRPGQRGARGPRGPRGLSTREERISSEGWQRGLRAGQDKAAKAAAAGDAGEAAEVGEVAEVAAL